MCETVRRRAGKRINGLVDDRSTRPLTCCSKGGAEGTRTPDPHTASVVRYQLRHGPLQSSPVARARRELYTRPPAWSYRGGPLAAQFSATSGGKWATAAIMPPWRRSTIGHRSSGRSTKASPGSASSTNQDPSSISRSTWPAPQPE